MIMLTMPLLMFDIGWRNLSAYVWLWERNTTREGEIL